MTLSGHFRKIESRFESRHKGLYQSRHKGLYQQYRPIADIYDSPLTPLCGNGKIKRLLPSYVQGKHGPEAFYLKGMFGD